MDSETVVCTEYSSSLDVHVVLTTRLLVLLIEKDNDKFNIAMLQDKKVCLQSSVIGPPNALHETCTKGGLYVRD